MKKNLTLLDINSTIGSSRYAYTQRNKSIDVKSPTLQKAIQRIKQQSIRQASLGISSITESKIPKHQSYYDVKLSQHTYRISKPQDEPKVSITSYDKKKETIKKITSLQNYCKSQSALEIAARKYTVKKINSIDSQNNENTLRPTLIDKLGRQIISRKNLTARDIIKQDLTTRMPKQQKEIMYELDSMFKNYKSYSKFCLTPNAITGKPIIYNGYFKIYNQSQHENIYLKEPDEDQKNASDDSIAFNNFLAETDEATIQKQVYHSNIRNPFLDDKVTVQTMRKSGLLKIKQL